jgi:enoyl-CoA hydratase
MIDDPDHLTEGLKEDDHGPVRWLTIERTRVHNALNEAVLDAIDRALDRIERSPEVRVLVITGAGTKAFSAGADLDEIAGLDVTAAAELLGRGGRVLRKIETCRVPVIAAVNGLALGGGFELALACTLIVASENATFALPETGLGLIPGYGGTQRLPRAIGVGIARRLVLAGDRLPAAEAHTAGLLACEPAPATELAAQVDDLTARICRRGPQATGAALDALRFGAGSSETGLYLERLLASARIASAEAAEGTSAFLQRRPPTFATMTVPGADVTP